MASAEYLNLYTHIYPSALPTCVELPHPQGIKAAQALVIPLHPCTSIHPRAHPACVELPGRHRHDALAAAVPQQRHGVLGAQLGDNAAG